MYKNLFLILFILIIGGALFFMFNILKKNNPDKILDKNINDKYEHGELVKIYYQKDASYHGGRNHVIVLKEDDNYKLVTEYSEERGDLLDIVEYKITKDDFIELENFIKKYNLPKWNNFGPPEYEELDGDFEDIIITYYEESNGRLLNKAYTISFDQNIPTKGFKILREFTEKMQSLKKEDNILIEYTKEDV